ncbi:MAG: FMN-dependent NADH-azoreductase [Pseudomonadota bacterium]|nr:FMN-dependent NADH-azoreductase [Pseudomonadota bacterium]
MTILKIDSSINGQNSASRALTDSIVEQLKTANWGDQLVTRDLFADPIPHLTLDAFADSSILEEFRAADIVVIGAPMYNFSVPSQLKAWIDRILIAGKTFHYTANGPEGLAKGKRVIIALARGGFYGSGSPAASLEHVESYLRGVFNFIGIEPEFVIAEGVNVSPEQRESALKQAMVEVELLAA